MMKTVAVIILATVGHACWAQTNTITFTNRNGVVSNAEPIRVEHSKLIYRTAAGGGMVRLSELPAELQARFGYDPATAAKDEMLEKERKKREVEQMRARATEEAATALLKRTKNQVAGGSVIVWGKVIQRLGDKLLVNADSQFEDGVSEMTKAVTAKMFHAHAKELGLPEEWQNGIPQKWDLARHIVLVENYPKVDSTVDGERIVSVAYPIGLYEYTTVKGSRSTVRKYTCSLDLAIINALKAEE